MSSLKNRAVKAILHAGVGFHGLFLGLTRNLKRKSFPASQTERTLLLTGTFFSENWIMNHLGPMAKSQSSSKVTIVCTFPIPSHPKIRQVLPFPLLHKLMGEFPARILTFLWLGLRERPDVVGGFHLLINGLAASLLARLIGARSLYLCGGGPREVLDGGIHGSRLFSYIGGADASMEKKLIASVNDFDAVITMGSRAIPFFRERGVTSRFEVIPGGIDASRFTGGEGGKEFDMVLIGRFDPVKRIDTYLKTLALLKKEFPEVKGVLVGRGQVEKEMKVLAAELGLGENILFAGYQQDVIPWLHKTKVFVLTSDSEGLSLALMEAMMCSMPVVVSDVGELGELVEHGVNGFLVGERTAENFADCIGSLLRDPAKMEAFSAAARKSALKLEVSETAKLWDRLLLEL